MLIDVALFSLLGIGYDAAGYGTGNLPAQYIHALRVVIIVSACSFSSLALGSHAS